MSSEKPCYCGKIVYAHVPDCTGAPEITETGKAAVSAAYAAAGKQDKPGTRHVVVSFGFTVPASVPRHRVESFVDDALHEAFEVEDAEIQVLHEGWSAGPVKVSRSAIEAARLWTTVAKQKAARRAKWHGKHAGQHAKPANAADAIDAAAAQQAATQPKAGWQGFKNGEKVPGAFYLTQGAADAAIKMGNIDSAAPATGSDG